MLQWEYKLNTYVNKGGFPRGEIIGEFAAKNFFYSDWLKMSGEFFRHEKVGIISTFS